MTKFTSNGHTLKSGETIPIRDMSDLHLLNTIRSIERRAAISITMQTKRCYDDYDGRVKDNKTSIAKGRQAKILPELQVLRY